MHGLIWPTAMRRAINGVWSIECGGHLIRIAELTKLVGPVEWENVDIREFLANDFYHQIHKALGYDVPGMEVYGEVTERWKNGELATQNGRKPIGYEN